ncbi:MAG: hypothetical protein DLM55_00790 [Acidimicrobiales bacterium]|nr:MAG: hypothetical protein DLM55_00790 [Acidimicrobiales bacterium]
MCSAQPHEANREANFSCQATPAVAIKYWGTGSYAIPNEHPAASSQPAVKNVKGYVFVGLASLMWASAAAVAKLLLDSLGNLQVVLFSTFFAFVVLATASVARGKLHLLRSYTSRDFLNFGLMAFIGVLAYRFLFLASLEYMPAQEAFVINYTWPVMVVLCAVVILRERLTVGKLIPMAASFLGVVIIATKGHIVSLELNAHGIALALSGAVAYGLFSTLGKKQDYDRLASTTLHYGFACLYALVLTVATSHIPSISLAQLAGLAWLGIFPGGLGFLCWSLALKHGDTAAMSNLVFLTPFLSAIYVYFLLGESITVSSIIGLMMIVGGIVIQPRKSTASSTSVAPT